MTAINRLVYLLSSGDLRLSANQSCWKAQHEMETMLSQALSNEGYEITRAHPYDEQKKHGFIDSQRMGMQVFKSIPTNALLIVAESVWQYSHHVLAGLTTHKGPILTVANWSGQWPGLVGMLNLNGSLTKANVKYSSLWSEDFKDDFFKNGLKQWLNTGTINHDKSHVRDFSKDLIPQEEYNLGAQFSEQFKIDKAIMGVFDEGCMGMFNAIVPDHLLHKTGIFKERLSQSTLYAKMLTVSNADAKAVLKWLLDKGMTFNWGTNEQTQLTKEQTLEQCKMYIAAVRIADEFGCDTIGIQYQQGLKDLTVASDLVEGLLNNTDRPPVYAENGKLLYANKALPHFNEVDECAGIDALVTYKLWEKLGLQGDNTLHDIRWGEHYKGDGIDDFVWVFLISGAVPASHFENGYADASSDRQPEMYFKLGGGTLKGVSKKGDFVWSRVYIENDTLQCDLGVGKAVELNEKESNRRWQSTTPQWPIMHAVLDGINRDQFMAKHQANHIHVVYADSKKGAAKACRIKAVAMANLGIEVHFCGNIDFNGSH